MHCSLTCSEQSGGWQPSLACMVCCGVWCGLGGSRREGWRCNEHDRVTILPCLRNTELGS